MGDSDSITQPGNTWRTRTTLLASIHLPPPQALRLRSCPEGPSARADASAAVVLFLINAGPVDLTWAKEHVAAIISAGYGGQYGGQAIADVITGAYNPGGALPYTLYTQAFADRTPYDSMQMRPNATSGSPGRTHRFLRNCTECVSWPFAYGRSYTSFRVDWARPPPPSVAVGKPAPYSLAVHNTGARMGDVVVTCFVAALEQTAVEQPPVRQLFAFDRVEALAAGQARQLTFTLTPESRKLTTTTGDRVDAPGRFRIDCQTADASSVTAPLVVRP